MCIAACLPSIAIAADFTWDGPAAVGAATGDPLWSNANHWVGDVAPSDISTVTASATLVNTSMNLSDVDTTGILVGSHVTGTLTLGGDVSNNRHSLTNPNQQEYAYGLDTISGSSVNPYISSDLTAGTFTYQRRIFSLTHSKLAFIRIHMTKRFRPSVRPCPLRSHCGSIFPFWPSTSSASCLELGDS